MFHTVEPQPISSFDMFHTVEPTTDEQLSAIVVTFQLPDDTRGIDDLEVFLDEEHKILVVHVGKVVNHVDLDPANRFQIRPGCNIKAKHLKKKNALKITVPVFRTDLEFEDLVSRMSPADVKLSQDLNFPEDSPVRIEVRPPPIGRCVVATRKIMPGETILLEEPFALLRLGETDFSAPAVAHCPEWQLTQVPAFSCAAAPPFRTPPS